MLRSIVLAVALAVSTSAWATPNLMDVLTHASSAERQYSPIPERLPDGTIIEARSGCCSHHGGVAGCDAATGHEQCGDGSDSPSCLCGE